MSAPDVPVTLSPRSPTARYSEAPSEGALRVDLERRGTFPDDVITPTGFQVLPWHLTGWDVAAGRLGWSFALSPLCILRFPF